MNLTVLKGNVGGDPEVKTFDNGNKVAKFALATSESYKNKTGEKITETDWHNIVFWGPVVDVIEKHVHKGDQIVVSGKIKYRSYQDKEGLTRYITEVVCDHFEFCGGKPKENTPAPADKQGEWQGAKANQVPADAEQGNDELSDLPF